MKEKVRHYCRDEAAVTYDSARCIHTAECLHGLSEDLDHTVRGFKVPS